MSPRVRISAGLAIFVISFAVRSLHQADLLPVVHTPSQPAGAMSAEFDARAVSIASGHGILIPDNHDAKDTSLLAHPPGYSVFLGAVYSVLGRSYLVVQLVQNVFNSLTPVVLFVFAGITFSWRVGVAAGLIAAFSHHLSYYSNFVLPDSICALPVLIATTLVAAPVLERRESPWAHGAAGLLIGASTWLRANALGLGLWVGLSLAAFGGFKKAKLRDAVLLIVMSFAAIVPITIRNYVLYGEFVAVRIGAGITLWEGIGDVDKGKFGGALSDRDVIEREAALYGDPAYGYSWSTPDGISRDRDRLRRGLRIISDRPLWYAGSIFIRMETGLKYAAHAPLVFRPTDAPMAVAASNEEVDDDEEAARARGRWAAAAGNNIGWARMPVRGIQRTVKETLPVFILLGAVIAFALSWRRAAFTMTVPLYYLLVQSTLHTEFRYTLPMQYYVFLLAGLCWILVISELIGLARTSAGWIRDRFVTRERGSAA
jgi:hypothetical protein